MIENPVEWFNKSGKYGLPTKYPVQFGSVFIIDEKAPDEVKKDYIKYINIAKKIFFHPELVFSNRVSMMV